jgi:hypothetical protein
MIPQLFRNQKPEYPQLSRMQMATKISAIYPQPRPTFFATADGTGRMAINIMPAVTNMMRNAINITTKIIVMRKDYMTRWVHMQ